MAAYRLFRDPVALRETLNPERLLGMLLRAARPLLLSLPPGVGKSFALLALVISDLWREQFGRVLWFVPTRRLQAELARKLTEAGVAVLAYPSHLDQPCQPNPELNSLVEAGMGQWAMISICGACPRKKWCDYARRCDPRFADGASVIIAPATLLSLDEMRVAAWSQEVLPSLVLIDDSAEDKGRFIRTFTRRELKAEVTATFHAGLYDLHLWLNAIAEHPDRRPPPPPPAWEGDAWRVQREGQMMLGYRHVLPTVVAWAANPLWQEGEQFAVHLPPQLPLSTILAGAFHDPNLLAWSYALDGIADPLAGWVVQHPGTTIVNVRSSIGAVSYWKGNQTAIASFTADLILANVARGETTVLLCRKDGETTKGKPSKALLSEALVAVRAALRQRGALHIRLLDPSEPLPENPSPTVIPHVLYGAVGTNELEGYQSLVALHGFHVSAEVLGEHLFRHLAPSQRPKFIFGKGRRIRWLTPVDAATRQRAVLVLRRLELDPVLQAAARVRFTIAPRRVILMVQHDLERLVGPVQTVRSLTEARQALGLLTAVDGRRSAMATAIGSYVDQGETLRHAAEALGIGEATAKRLAHEAGITARRGRPPKKGSVAI